MVERASREMGSVHFGGRSRASPGAFVYTEVQVHGGLYAFDTVEDAKRFAIDFFARSAARQGAPYTTRIFDARATEHTNRAGSSPYYR